MSSPSFLYIATRMMILLNLKPYYVSLLFQSPKCFTSHSEQRQEGAGRSCRTVLIYCPSDFIAHCCPFCPLCSATRVALTLKTLSTHCLRGFIAAISSPESSVLRYPNSSFSSLLKFIFLGTQPPNSWDSLPFLLCFILIALFN